MFLGVDLGTQSLKAILISNELKVLHAYNINFDNELPHYKTTGGAIIHTDQETVTVPPLLWVEAFELLFERMKQIVDLRQVKAISGSAQQHGSVYWRKGSRQILQNLDSSKTLKSQLEGMFVVDSPIWMDSSTTKWCKMLEKGVGGHQRLASLTGSRAHCRFTASQIAKLYETRQKEMKECERISLVSSFLGSLFVGDYVPIDFSDGSGMNLLDMKTCTWSSECMKALGLNEKELVQKLGQPVDSSEIVGKVSTWMAKRFGFSKDCIVIAHSGDNPNSACYCLRGKGDVSVSTGTSFTISGFVDEYCPNADEGHVFISPVFKEGVNKYLPLVCFKNGGLVIKEVRDRCCNKSWDKFNECLKQTPPGNNGNIGFYYLFPEITPTTTGKGIPRTKNHNILGYFRFNSKGELLNEKQTFPDAVEVRALVESQFMACRLHAERLGIKNPKRILATGGGSTNVACLQVLADIFGCDVYISKETSDGAALGACLRAFHGYHQQVNKISFDVIWKRLPPHQLACRPNQQATAIYQQLLPKFEQLEKLVIKKLTS